MRRLIAILGVLVLVLGILGGFVAPRVAASVIEDRLEEDLAGRFRIPITVEVDVAGPAPLLRGEIAEVRILADEYVGGNDEGAIRLFDVVLTLRGVRVDLGAAMDGSLDEVELEDSVVQASLALDTVADLLGDQLASGGSGFTLASLVADGPTLVVEVGLPDGTTRSATVRPVVADGIVVLRLDDPTGEEDARERALRSALAGLEVNLPSLPLDIELIAVGRVLSDELRLVGRLPQPLLLS